MSFVTLSHVAILHQSRLWHRRTCPVLPRTLLLGTWVNKPPTHLVRRLQPTCNHNMQQKSLIWGIYWLPIFATVCTNAPLWACGKGVSNENGSNRDCDSVSGTDVEYQRVAVGGGCARPAIYLLLHSLRASRGSRQPRRRQVSLQWQTLCQGARWFEDHPLRSGRVGPL